MGSKLCQYETESPHFCGLVKTYGEFGVKLGVGENIDIIFTYIFTKICHCTHDFKLAL